MPSIEFIRNSPFLCLATTNPENSSDCSPKGDPNGFVKIINRKTLAIPDRRGNNRLDSLINILYEPKVGILFFIPGRNETLRVNGIAKLVNDPKLMETLTVNNISPKIAIVVDIDEVFLHCPKSLIRSKLWNDNIQDRDLQSYIKAKNDQLGIEVSKLDIEKQAKEYNTSLKDKLY